MARSDDAAIISDRQDLMKAQGKDLSAIKAFTEDKGDLAAAQTAGADLVTRIPKIPDLFPKGTGLDAYPGKSYAKPAIWTEHDKFLAAHKNALTAAEALNTALKSGDKAAITTAYGNMTRDFWGTSSPNPGACGGCHGTFTEKKPPPKPS
jgi:cytochrome c556